MACDQPKPWSLGMCIPWTRNDLSSRTTLRTMTARAIHARVRPTLEMVEITIWLSSARVRASLISVPLQVHGAVMPPSGFGVSSSARDSPRSTAGTPTTRNARPASAPRPRRRLRSRLRSAARFMCLLLLHRRQGVRCLVQ